MKKVIAIFVTVMLIVSILSIVSYSREKIDIGVFQCVEMLRMKDIDSRMRAIDILMEKRGLVELSLVKYHWYAENDEKVLEHIADVLSKSELGIAYFEQELFEVNKLYREDIRNIRLRILEKYFGKRKNCIDDKEGKE